KRNNLADAPPQTEESLDPLAYIRQRFPYRRARGELRLFSSFYHPAGLGREHLRMRKGSQVLGIGQLNLRSGLGFGQLALSTFASTRAATGGDLARSAYAFDTVAPAR